MKYISIILIIVSSLNIYGQGFCSLRNPQAKIKALFPNCQNFKTIVSSIDQTTRKELNELLPFPLHYYEIGRHNLYMISEDGEIQGLVHARSEQSKWGLVEVVWSLGLDLTVKDFSFQRCRTSAKLEVMKPHIKQFFIGKSFYDLLALKPQPEKLSKDHNSQELIELLYQSALKTIALTDIAWKNKLKEYRTPKFFTEKKNTQRLTNSTLSYLNSNGRTYFKITTDALPNYDFCGVYKNGFYSEFYIPLSSKINRATIQNIKLTLNKKLGQLK